MEEPGEEVRQAVRRRGLRILTRVTDDARPLEDGATGSPGVVVVPGAGLDRRSWAPTLHALAAAGVETDVVLLPGYGQRARWGSDLTPRTLGALLVDRLRERGVRNAVLAGHSGTCPTVVHAALRAPDLVAGLVLVGPVTDPRARTWPPLVRRWLATARFEPRGAMPAWLRQYTTVGVPSALRAVGAARPDVLVGELAQVGCPVVLVRGHEDRIAPADWVDHLAGCRPASGDAVRSVVTLPGGHMLPTTQPAGLSDVVARLVADVGEPGGYAEAGTGG